MAHCHPLLLNALGRQIGPLSRLDRPSDGYVGLLIQSELWTSAMQTMSARVPLLSNLNIGSGVVCVAFASRRVPSFDVKLLP
eukprot:4094961-Pleurochrysis_carterae.AAC.3